MRSPSLVAWLSISLAVGCGAADEPGPQQPAPTQMTGDRPRGMRNCPAAVGGAITDVERVPDGVILTIRAAGREARSEIMARTERSVAVGAQREGQRPHNGRGGGPEAIGYCPVILAGNTVTYSRLPDGVRIRMRPRDARDVTSLQGRVEARARTLRAEIPTS